MNLALRFSQRRVQKPTVVVFRSTLRIIHHHRGLLRKWQQVQRISFVKKIKDEKKALCIHKV